MRPLSEVRLLALDFDGVLTDNYVSTANDGSETVRSWRGDGLGLERLRKLGIPAIVLTDEPSGVADLRCKKLGLAIRHCGEVTKHDALLTLLGFGAGGGIDTGQVAYIGNDINDLECLRSVGFPVIVADAHPALNGYGFRRTVKPGGQGAVREVCDLIADAIEAERRRHYPSETSRVRHEPEGRPPYIPGDEIMAEAG